MEPESVVSPWNRHPFIRLILPFTGGILGQVYYPLPVPAIKCVFIGCIVCLVLLQNLPIATKGYYNAISGFIVLALLFAAGAWITWKVDIKQDRRYFGNRYAGGAFLLIEVNSLPEEKANSYKALGMVSAVIGPCGLVSTSGQLILYWPKQLQLRKGSRFLTRAVPQRIANSGNPGSFDYEQFCARQQLFCQAYITQAAYFPLQTRRHTDWIENLAGWCLQQLKKYIGNGPEAGMAEALLIGYRQDMDKEVARAYSNAGIVHVIAISGMHLALLYSSLLVLLKFLPIRKYTGLLQAVIILFVLWTFALITGASASVLRAVVMCSVMVTGKFVIQQQGHSYNTFIASAFLVLSYDPYLLFDLGFQLSYLAVGSIMLFYNRIYELVSTRSKFIKLIWQSVAISLAAQLLTTPVTLFYFHQFPSYFLLANLVAVPLSTVVIYLEAFLLMLVPFPLLAAWMGKAVYWLIHFMNRVISWLGHLPGAVIEGIHFSALQMWLCYGLICSLAGWWMRGWKQGCLFALLCCWGMAADEALWQLRIREQKWLMVYHSPRQTIIDCIQGNKAMHLATTDTLPELVRLARSALGVTATLKLSHYGNYIAFGGKRIMLAGALPRCYTRQPLKLDYLVVTDQTSSRLSQLRRLYDFKLLVLPAGIRKHKREQWRADCRQAQQAYYDVDEQKALMINMKY
ncbi:competence protein ComEC [Chitinophaga terrae (ex Kim and Jung 2007)]|uniref:Competence protein ComEC n=1 Tax=Chitinophaga terrae (ex Kim and Jung 2007) TaxID=408074 RepID=A0A1H4G7Z9_9BACT|nr:ComEC/Rec2 family competence protein [Chitinophaga terrae (ex Kim and Jung 2007)]MDQ0105633.1 competence protein ComEC [Chitinophaga terrae (ex Kim and Jung 2007)]SEB05018.1 competence protein ComEC [Chitinophaga terrae (ex Kim and Jung 2007)]